MKVMNSQEIELVSGADIVCLETAAAAGRVLPPQVIAGIFAFIGGYAVGTFIEEQTHIGSGAGDFVGSTFPGLFNW